jgi:hypothetical protein
MKIAVRAEQDIESLATFVHGELAGLPALGIVYNIKHQNFPQTSAQQWIFSTFPWSVLRHHQRTGSLYPRRMG